MIGRGILVAAALSALPLSASAQTPSNDQPAPLEAGKENTGRISVINGEELFGRGPYDEETWELSINAVVREGDELFTEDGTFAEVELPGGTFLRLDGDTTVVLQRVNEQGIELALAGGSLYVSRGTGALPVMVQTFGGAVELGGNSMTRVGTDRTKTQIEVRTAKGSAEMRADKTNIAVPENKSLVWTRTGSRNDAWSSATYDDFDRWNQKREDTVRGISRPANVASSAMGSYELEGNGTWVMIDGYYAWRPTTVYTGWRPYSYGYWAWTEPWGWTWCDYYGWGYTTSHYGRWYYRSHYGWVWYPDAYWAGSYVVWAAFGPHIGWAPCDYWGRPIYVYSYYSYYDYGAWCYSDADYFYYGGGYRPRGVRTSTGRTTGRGGVATTVGRGGGYAIRTFDAETIRQYSPVPVRNSRSELTPKNIADAAGRGQIKGIKGNQRSGEFLARAVKDGGVKPEPWADRNSRDGAGRDPFGSSGKSGRNGMTDPSGGRDPGRANEGWGRPGESKGNRDAFGGSNERGGNDGWNSNDRGGSSNDRGGSPFGGSSQTNDRGRGWNSNDRGGSSNDRGGSSVQQPSRNDSGSSSSQPKQRDSGNSNKSTPPPRQDNDNNKKSNDSNKPKPRSSWSDTTASAPRDGWSKRGEKPAASANGGSGYSYSNRDSGSGSSGSSRSSAPSRDSGSSYQAPSRSNGGSSSYSAPSYSAPSRGSSAPQPSYSSPKRSSGGSSSGSYSAPKSSGGGRSSGSSSSSSSSSSGGSRSSSSSSSSSNSKSSGGGKRGR